jgi:hypothetical protein
MPLPANPSDGQTALLNGISYVYDGAKGAWRRQATSITVSDFVVQGNLTLASNVESTSSSTGALVISGGLGVSGSVYSGGVYTNSLFYSNGSPYTVGGAGGGGSGYFNPAIVSGGSTTGGGRGGNSTLVPNSDDIHYQNNAGQNSDSVVGATAGSGLFVLLLS